MTNSKVTAQQIFVGAVFENDKGTFEIERVREGDVYGCCDKFDSSAETKEEMAEKLNRWGYTYCGAE